MLRAEFSSVVRHDFVSQLLLEDLAPLRAYVVSMVDTAQLPAQLQSQHVGRIVELLSKDTDGLVRITTHPGPLICSWQLHPEDKKRG